jgi:hypothetical protein
VVLDRLSLWSVAGFAAFPAVLAAGGLRAALPRFLDYFHFSFTTAMAFSPTDVSAIKPGPSS